MKVEPIYKTFKGWNTDITKIGIYEKMPENMKTYIQYINQFLGISIDYISNGPGTDQIVCVEKNI